MTWILIILWSISGHPASTTAVFASADLCKAAKEAVAGDLGKEHHGPCSIASFTTAGSPISACQPEPISILSADCYIQSGSGK